MKFHDYNHTTSSHSAQGANVTIIQNDEKSPEGPNLTSLLEVPCVYNFGEAKHDLLRYSAANFCFNKGLCML